MSQITESIRVKPCTLVTRLSNSFSLFAYLFKIGWRHPTLRRWYLGNRLRQLTVYAQYALSREGYSSPPRSISFRPTFLCNARCKMCSYANSIDPDTLQPITGDQEIISFEIACRLADAIAPSHTMLNITGGEPLVWGEKLFDFLDYCRGRGVPTSVITNGTLLGRYLDRLLESPPDVLLLSLLGPEDTHDGIVGIPAFGQVRQAFIELLDRKGGDLLAPPLVITNTAMLPENMEVFAEVPRLAQSMGAAVANFQPLWTVTEEMHQSQEETEETYDRRFTACNGVDTERMNPERIWWEMQRTLSLAGELGQPVHFYPRLRERDMEAYYHHPEQPIGRSRALCAHLISQVLPDGTVSPCLGHTVGNLHEQDFLSIWNGSAMRAFRQRLKAARMFPICSRCCLLWRND